MNSIDYIYSRLNSSWGMSTSNSYGTAYLWSPAMSAPQVELTYATLCGRHIITSILRLSHSHDPCPYGCGKRLCPKMTGMESSTDLSRSVEESTGVFL